MSERIYTGDATSDRLNGEVGVARAKILHAIRADVEWDCPHCGQSRKLDKPPWSPRAVREAAGVDTTVGSIAFMGLLRDGTLTADESWQVSPGDEKPKGSF